MRGPCFFFFWLCPSLSLPLSRSLPVILCLSLSRALSVFLCLSLSEARSSGSVSFGLSAPPTLKTKGRSPRQFLPFSSILFSIHHFFSRVVACRVSCHVVCLSVCLSVSHIFIFLSSLSTSRAFFFLSLSLVLGLCHSLCTEQGN